MYARLRSLNYPIKGYVFIVLAVCSVISTLWIINVRLPSGGRPYLFIWWNMMLAWIPMLLTLLLDVIYSSWRRGTRTFLLWITGAVWLFFYPNTPYLITDLLHVFARYPFLGEQRFWGEPYFWNHVLGMLLVAVLGLTMGFISLESVRQLVRRARGGFVSWLFVLAVLLLSSLGIYIGTVSFGEIRGILFLRLPSCMCRCPPYGQIPYSVLILWSLAGWYLLFCSLAMYPRCAWFGSDTAVGMNGVTNDLDATEWLSSFISLNREEE